jgi:hypothetical protein
MKISRKSLRILVEAYVKRHIADSQGGAIRQELVDAPPRFERKFLQQVYQKFYNERQVDAVNSMRMRAGMSPLSYKDRKQFLEYIRKLDSETLYNIQSNAYRVARNQTERYVSDQMQANPLTKSDYAGEGTNLIDATKRSELYFTDNDFDFIYPNPENIPFQDIQRVALLQTSDLEGVAPGVIQYQSGQMGVDIDAYVDMLASQRNDPTEPLKGSQKYTLKNLKRPENFTPDPKFVVEPIEDETKTM